MRPETTDVSSNVVRLLVLGLASLAVAAAPAMAQAPPPHKIWDVAASVGLAATSGNSDTSQFNVGYDLTYDPLTRNIFKSNALLLRGSTEGDVSAERFLFNVRDEYKLNDRTFVFGSNLYLRDRFKSISYLDAVTGGIGYKILASERTKLDVDGGAGGVWEKNTGLDLKSSGAVTAGEKLQHLLTSTTTLTQSVAALWKTNDFEDALLTFGAGVAVAVSTRTQLKFEVVDVYKNKPPSADVQKNDVATVVAIVFKS
jgi:putative salt-induced outer membrane protein